MSMTRIWNITDGGQPGMKAHTRTVLGRSVKPGRAIRVEEAALKNAHKVNREIQAGFLHVGNTPPSWYAAKKKPPRAKVQGRRINEQGRAYGSKTKVVPGHGSRPSAEEIAANVAAASKVKASKKKVSKTVERRVDAVTLPEEPLREKVGKTAEVVEESSSKKRKRR
jgi:hypothetical protein